MASSDFWRDIAEQFGNIRESEALTAEWADLADTGVGLWFLTGSNSAGYSFEALARRAATEIARGSDSDLLTIWLNELRRQDFGFKETGFILMSGPDEPERKRCHAGQINRVCEVSANFCRKLEAEAVQAEFEKKKQLPFLTLKPVAISQSPTAKSPDTKRVKKQDLSRYLDAAKLTERQYQCASLRWEYGLSVSAIARELKLSRMTIDQHIKFAQKKFDASDMYQKMRKQLARTAPED